MYSEHIHDTMKSFFSSHEKYPFGGKLVVDIVSRSLVGTSLSSSFFGYPKKSNWTWSLNTIQNSPTFLVIN